MIDPCIEALQAAIEARWGATLAYGNDGKDKVGRYVGKFFSCTRLQSRISGKVVGNYGTYTVTIRFIDHMLTSARSNYIGARPICPPIIPVPAAK